MKLSILIPTLPQRGEFLSRILGILGPQLNDDVEVLVNMDNGHQTVGEKRNALLQSARGEYVCSVDDDDRVTEDYVQQMLVGISLGRDVVSVRGEVNKNGKFYSRFIDEPYAKIRNEVVDGVLTCFRGTQHLDAVKRYIALSCKFEHRRFAEDSRWTMAIEATGLVKTYYQIPHTVYYYDWRLDRPRAREFPQKSVAISKSVVK